jgi:hypothetical protein
MQTDGQTDSLRDWYDKTNSPFSEFYECVKTIIRHKELIVYFRKLFFCIETMFNDSKL